MRILLDTHCRLWRLTQPEKLNEEAREILAEGSNTIFLSAASSWEISIKYSLGKLSLPEPPEGFVPKRLLRDGVSSLPIEHIHALRVGELPYHHRDPFDRLIIAQAMIEQLPVMTVDIQFKPYDVKIVWA
jgi:PIN domain nuclease of toxin-antitoxin system